MADVIEVSDNPESARYEVKVDGNVAGFVDYHLRGDKIALTHTEVFPEYEGQGLAGRLARTALDSARDAGLSVIPTCPYIAKYIERHPEYANLVADAG
jgi:hypothetical protein